MQSGGNNMNAAQLARLQQQLAQYGRGNGQQSMMNNMGGMGQNPQLQQAFMQQQLQQNQGNQGGMARRNSALGMNGNSAAALAMMQQQQVGGSNMGNAYWNALQGQNTGGAMDASSASSAQLAALAGMNMNMNNNSSTSSSQNNNANMLLGNRSSQTQNPGMGNQQMQGMGQTNDANMLQQQIAQLQRQLQQQQQQSQNQGMGMQGSTGIDRHNSAGNFNMQGGNQQLFQQMQMNGMMDQGMGGMGNSGSPSMNNMMQGQNMSSQSMRGMGNSQGMMSGSGGGLSERELLLQQQQLLRSSNNMSSSMQNDNTRSQDMFSMQNQDLMGQRRNNSGNMGGNFNSNNNVGAGFDMDASVSSQRSNSVNPLMGDKGDESGNQKSFLDGSFAGGWQSNADLPDRRRIIFSILEVIRQMRPDTNKISQKLPHMAKSLEEHLYRSAQTKEEYLDPSTLKKRLQLIAHGLEIHRSSSGSVGGGPGDDPSGMQQGSVQSEAQQLQQFLSMQQGGGNMNQNQGGMGMNMSNSMQMDMLQGMGGGAMDTSINGMDQSQSDGMNSSQDRVTVQKKKVIRQQQQRLLLLRHASKCKEGPSCKTKFCSQMMTLWKHMKKCRDKNCKTSHCLSSRCVLNHYRICKSQGRTSTCEVCGPVMEQIKRQDQEGNIDSNDPLAAKPDPDLPNQALPQLQQQMSGFNPGGDQQSNNMQAMQQQAMQQLFQQQQALQNHQGMQNQNSLQALGGGGMQGMQNDIMNSSQNSGGNDSQQMQALQNAQQKLQQQQQVLQQLQKQQQQLQEQQRQLQEQQVMLKDPSTPQAQQLQQQHQLLQQLQRRCQQQQALIQQEMMLQMKTLEQGGQDVQRSQQLNQTLEQNQGSQQMGSSQNSHHSQPSNPMQGDMPISGMNQEPNMMSQMQNSIQDQSPSNDDQDLLQIQPNLDSQPSSDGQEQEIQSQSPQKEDEKKEQLEELNEGSAVDQENDKTGDPATISVPASGPSAPEQVDSSSSKNDEAKDDQDVADLKDRPKPGGVRGKGARGRGGKGKRLRDIADDLGSAGAPLSATDATSISERKRDLEAMGSSDDGPPSKQSKSDGPDSDKAGDGESSSLTGSMPKGDVEQHLLLLHKGLHLTSRTITHKCLPIVQQLIDDPFGWVFRDAVDPVVFGLPDYFEVVKNPMHLLLVKKKLENAVYTDMASFERDVKLVFENAILYNGDESEVGQLAQTMMGVFEREYKKVCEEISIDLHTIGPNDCSLCGLNRRKFQSSVLYCVGMTCGMQQIKRNALYYTKGSKQNIWCDKCYAKLKDGETIMLEDGSETRKSRLHEAKNDSNPEETWVRCDDCKANVHQICALTSDRIRCVEEKWFCPKCELKNRKDFFLRPRKFSKTAENLKRCETSDFIEIGVHKNLEKAYRIKAEEVNCQVEDIEKANGISIRVLSHIATKHSVRDEMFELYSKAGCPSDFPSHTKCIGLFQKIDGIDVLLFAMYVYEYGHDCPAPNRRRVYISYLDSVQYFQPRNFRTIAYQSVITEYLRFAKKRGFHTAHIWSCPPTPGDEYVFYCHPPSQKIPQEEKLRGWYVDLLERAKEDGIVVETTNFYDEYFADAGSNAPGTVAITPMSLPYFEGDYIPGEIENILSHLSKEEKRNLPIAKAVPRRSGLKLGTRSNPGSLVSQTQDKIMQRLGKAIYNMKENLMIVRLRSKAFASAVERGDDVSKWPDDEESIPVVKREDSGTLVVNDDDDDAKKEGSPTTDALGSDELDDNAAMAIPISRAFAHTAGPRVGSTEDKDPLFESELFENRQLFLNYCQANNCQFDELRKAKHTTMMVLYQLHTPNAPKFLEQCGACQRDIAFGQRYHCNICANFDLCDECYKPVSSGKWKNRGKRYQHDTSHSFSRISLRESAEAKRSADERQKSLQGYLEVLAHAANCEGAPACKLNNCEKMKTLFVHVQTCDLTYLKGCKVCHRLVSLIIVHARSCSIRGSCSLPFCDKIRERNERVRRQQRHMDDRRRQAQNTYYGAGDSN